VLLECVHRLVRLSAIVWKVKLVSTINVLTDVPKTTNVLNFMNAGEEFALWLKNVVQMATVLELNLVLLPFLIWDKENAAMFVKVLSFVAAMLFANPATIDLYAFVQKDFLETPKMRRSDA
jgi:hypothetical protein